MRRLFCLATNTFTLNWDRARDGEHAVLARTLPVLGRLHIQNVASSVQMLDSTTRSDVPNRIAAQLDCTNGPPLYEQTDYSIYARTKNPSDTIQIRHRDPMMERSLSVQENGQVVHGVINFRNQIGRSLFSVEVNGRRQVDFEVEVFPTKIDYATDYQEILADVQSILTSLAYEYLRSTYQMGKSNAAARPSKLEWLVLVEHIMTDLEKAMHFIAQRPVRGLVRRDQTARVERIRRIDSRVLAQVRRGQGNGGLVRLNGHNVRERLSQRPPEPTLDTMEHRWLRSQLEDMRRMLGTLARLLGVDDESSQRRQRALEAIEKLKGRVARLLALEPIAAAEGELSAGFASLQLVSAPGYREAYRLLRFLRMGLRLEGDLCKLAVKDLDLLYEYWSYLKVAGILSEEFGSPKDLESFFRIGQNGLAVQLKKGEAQKLTFRLGVHRKVTLLYNPSFANPDTTLIPQKPDILIRLEDDGWPRIQLVCDAKYRVDATDQYRGQFGTCGPPTDAINVLHRYRDAILELESDSVHAEGLKRSVVQAAALFPLNHIEGDPDFRTSRLWKAIERIGVGAIPTLPSNCVLLKEWILSSLRRGSWSLADRAIASSADQQARDWRVAASQPVLIGVLRSPGAEDHLHWIQRERMYYQPRTQSQRRQFAVKQVALYVPIGLREPNGIRYVADVEQIDVVDRSEIQTPWPARRHESMVLYRLGPVREMANPIGLGPQETMGGQWRWTTRLGLERARCLSEVGLETEPEWRLLEWLRANQLLKEIKLAAAGWIAADNPKGRAWFHLRDGTFIRYDGSNGFLVRKAGGADRFVTLEGMVREWGSEG
jgi:uncharacterized protein